MRLPHVLSFAALVAACSSSNGSDLGSGSSGALQDATTPATDSGGTVGGSSGSSGSSGGLDAQAPLGDGAASDAQADAEGDGGRDFSTDPTTFGGATRCAQANVALCEDFESGTLDTKTWTVVGTKPIIDGVQKMRGQKALHITQVGNGPSYIKETKTFPAPKNTYFGRAFVYFASLPALPLTYAHWTFIAASGTGVSGEIRVSAQLQNGNNHFGVGTDNRVDANGTGDWTSTDADPKPPNPVPKNKWICIEWMHKGDTNETRFYWDDVEHPSLATTAAKNGGNGKPYILPTFTNAWIGWQEYQATTETFEMWVDEVAIDAARIGCVL